MGQAWLWKRSTGEEYELPETLDFTLADVDIPVPVTRPESRDGGVVDAQRATLAPRGVHMSGRMQFDSLGQSYEHIARLGWILSGGLGRLCSRARWDRYLQAVMVRYSPEPELSGLVWSIGADLIAPDALWLDAVEQLHTVSIATAGGGESSFAVGGQWKVWPQIRFSASGASVTNPRIDLLDDGRFVLASTTLSAGQTLVLDPEAVTAKVGTAGMLDVVNLEWFNPFDRFSLPPTTVRVKVSAGSIGTGGSLIAELRWRRRWL